MSEMPGLFSAYSEDNYDEPEESRSAGVKIVVCMIVVGLVAAFGTIAYFGVGPMLVKPYVSPVQSYAPDVAEVLGLGSSQQGGGIVDITDDVIKQQLLQRLMAEVSIPEDERVSVLLIEQIPQHTPESLFAKAAINDVLFVLTQTGTVYLYRPAEDKIIASGSAAVEN